MNNVTKSDEHQKNDTKVHPEMQKKDETQPENKLQERKDRLPTKGPVRKNENPLSENDYQLFIFLHILIVY